MNVKLLWASVALGVVMAFPQPANAVCTGISVTADEMSKAGAIARSQSGLKEAIDKWAKDHGIKRVRVSPSKAKPQPYWRSTVTEDLLLKPDVKTSKFYTVCWRGVISPAVCTSGAKVCG